MTLPDILLVEDDPASMKLMTRILRDVGHLRFASNGAQALAMAHEAPPDLILLDAQMPGMSGFDVCIALKADGETVHVPVIFVTSHSEPEFETTGFEIGAVDFIAKPVFAESVLARVNAQLRLKATADEMRRRATVDALTSLGNRRLFDEGLDREWRRARRSGEPVCLLMVDVDHFKRYNDRYGHPAGDTCLRAVAGALQAATHRPGDLAARYGGEEFTILLPRTPRTGAVHMARGVLDAVAALGMAHDASPTCAHVTVSIGIGCYDEHSSGWKPGGNDDDRVSGFMDLRLTANDLLGAADTALYRAKDAGRSQAWQLDIGDATVPSLARWVDVALPGDDRGGP